MNLPDKIMTLRRRRGWSQEELAERLDVSRQSVSKWEMGQSVPELDKIVQMSDLFGVSADQLVRGEMELDPGDTIGDPAEKAETPEPGRTIRQSDAVELIRRARVKNLLTAFGVALCILSPILLIMEQFVAGAVVLPVLICVAVACFILAAHFWRETPFAVYERGDRLSPDAGTFFRERYPAANLRFLLLSMFGVLLFILSPVPLVIFAILHDGNITDAQGERGVAVLLAVVAVGVFLILMRGKEMAVWERFRTILEGKKIPEELRDGEEPQEALAREVEERRDPIGKFYWSIITAAYLLISFLTERWQYTWLIWPVAALLYSGFEAILYFRRRSK